MSIVEFGNAAYYVVMVLVEHFRIVKRRTQYRL